MNKNNSIENNSMKKNLLETIDKTVLSEQKYYLQVLLENQLE